MLIICDAYAQFELLGHSGQTTNLWASCVEFMPTHLEIQHHVMCRLSLKWTSGKIKMDRARHLERAPTNGTPTQKKRLTLLLARILQCMQDFVALWINRSTRADPPDVKNQQKLAEHKENCLRPQIRSVKFNIDFINLQHAARTAVVLIPSLTKSENF